MGLNPDQLWKSGQFVWKMGKAGWDADAYVKQRMNDLLNKGYDFDTAKKMIEFEQAYKTNADFWGGEFINKTAPFQGDIGAAAGTVIGGPIGDIAGGGVGEIGFPLAEKYVLSNVDTAIAQHLSADMAKNGTFDVQNQINNANSTQATPVLKTGIEENIYKPDIRPAIDMSSIQPVYNGAPPVPDTAPVDNSLPVPGSAPANNPPPDSSTGQEDNGDSSGFLPSTGSSAPIFTRENIGSMDLSTYLQNRDSIINQMQTIGIPSTSGTMDYSKYQNPLLDESNNRIFTTDDINSMSSDEYNQYKPPIFQQNSDIGIPSNQDLQALAG